MTIIALGSIMSISAMQNNQREQDIKDINQILANPGNTIHNKLRNYEIAAQRSLNCEGYPVTLIGKVQQLHATSCISDGDTDLRTAYEDLLNRFNAIAGISVSNNDQNYRYLIDHTHNCLLEIYENMTNPHNNSDTDSDDDENEDA